MDAQPTRPAQRPGLETNYTPLPSAPTAPAPATAPVLRRDAIIYLPGIGLDDRVRSGHALARRLARALEPGAGEAAAQFLLKEEGDEPVRNSPLSTRRVTVLRREPGPNGAERPVADVFDLPYHPLLVGDMAGRSAAGQALTVLGTFVVLVFRVAARAFRPRQPPTGMRLAERLQVWAGLVVMAALLAYVVVLVMAAVAALLALAADPKAGATVVVPAAVRHAYDAVAGRVGAVVLLLTALGLTTRTSLKHVVQDAGATLHGACRYLAMGRGAGDARGAFAALLQHVLETDVDEPGGRYANVHVVAYSFGSVVALDCLFPATSAPQHLARVASLTTVGCPFDLVRTYWPDYFAHRHEAPLPVGGAALAWTNFYADADVLASRFEARNGAGYDTTGVGVERPDGTVEVRTPLSVRYGPDGNVGDQGPIEQLTLVGFRTHRTYWEGPDSDSCFDAIVPRLYGGGHFVLS